jgi:hypothetical protein
MAKQFIFNQISNMILGSQAETLVHLKGRQRLLPLKELDGLFPSSLSFICPVVAPKSERQSCFVFKLPQLFFDILCKPFGIGSSLIGVSKDLLVRNYRQLVSLEMRINFIFDLFFHWN